jgi:hypothetical protein
LVKIQGVSSKDCQLHYYWYKISVSNKCIFLFNTLQFCISFFDVVCNGGIDLD